MGGFFALYQKSSQSSWRVYVLIFLTMLLGYSTQYLATGKIILRSLGYFRLMEHQYIWGYSLMNYVFAVLLIQIRDDKLLPGFFNNIVLYYLGQISYGLYVFHFGIQWLVWTLFPALSAPASFSLAFLATILVSAASYELYEKHFINMKDKFFSKKRPALAKPAPAPAMDPENGAVAATPQQTGSAAPAPSPE